MGAKTDNLIANKNKAKWMSGKTPYFSRPGLSSSFYLKSNMGTSSTVNLMNPYGGLIWVYLNNNNPTSFELTFDGATEAPYFIQGMGIKLDRVEFRFSSHGETVSSQASYL